MDGSDKNVEFKQDIDSSEIQVFYSNKIGKDHKSEIKNLTSHTSNVPTTARQDNDYSVLFDENKNQEFGLKDHITMIVKIETEIINFLKNQSTNKKGLNELISECDKKFFIRKKVKIFDRVLFFITKPYEINIHSILMRSGYNERKRFKMALSKFENESIDNLYNSVEKLYKALLFMTISPKANNSKLSIFTFLKISSNLVLEIIQKKFYLKEDLVEKFKQETILSVTLDWTNEADGTQEHTVFKKGSFSYNMRIVNNEYYLFVQFDTKKFPDKKLKFKTKAIFEFSGIKTEKIAEHFD